MAGNGDPGEDTAEVTLVDAAEVASTWKLVGTKLDGIGHQVAALKATGVGFPDKINAALMGIGQGCTSVAAQWTTAGGDVQRQHDNVDTPKAAAYKTATEAVQKAKTSVAQGLMIAAMGGSPAFAQSAQSSLASERAKRQTVLDTAVTDTKTHVQALPGHGRIAGEAVTTARATMITDSSGGKPLPADVQQIVPPTSTAPTKSTDTRAKPSNTSPTGTKPTDTKPSDNKSATDDKGTGDPSSTKPQQSQQGQGQQPNAQQQPQQGGAQPQSAAPAGGQPSTQQRGPGALPVSTPTPMRGTDPSKGGAPSVRPSTPPSPPSTPAQRAGLDGRTSPLGSGTNATGAGAANPAANKSGGSTGTGGSTSGAGSSARPMGGGMMGGGHGGGGQGGGTARPKGEVKADPRDKKLRGEDVAEQALGGVVRDGDTGAPVPPAAPGSNGGAPVPSPPPVKP